MTACHGTHSEHIVLGHVIALDIAKLPRVQLRTGSRGEGGSVDRRALRTGTRDPMHTGRKAGNCLAVIVETRSETMPRVTPTTLSTRVKR